ncbi:MAG: hypothetical protein C4303_02005 [candidate division GAL15 bacterium]
MVRPPPRDLLRGPTIGKVHAWSFAQHLPVVVEVKRRPDGTVVRYPCRLVQRRRASTVLLYVLEEPWQVADLPLPVGVATFAYYWASRWYNVYHWVSPDGASLGHYANVATPAHLTEASVEWTDLGADVLGLPGGPPRVLDREELESLPADLWVPARRALRDVLQRWPHLVSTVERSTRAHLARLRKNLPAPPG